MLFDRTGPGWDYEELVVLNDRALGLRAIIAVDSTARGPAFGGVRRRTYPSEEAALADSLWLASSMSFKCALAGLPAGGAKTVIMHREGLDLPRVYQCVGQAIERLAGRYVCGPDVGTGRAELGWIREHTSHVNPLENDAGQSTADGVLAALRAVWAHLELDPRGSSVALQGCGSVGVALIPQLVALGVRVVAADISVDAVRAGKAAGAEIVAPSRIMDVPCDVFVPCALGGTLTVEAVAALECRAVCGSANNQLAEDAAALALHRRSIVHAPDVLTSAGAVIEGVLSVGGQRSAVADAIARIERTTAEVLSEAKQRQQPPSVIAVQRARALVADAADAGA